ncbi:phospholipid-binding protein MlaC [Candidatus Tisiphia endosymbiont of Ptychoptera albimana]|uniref:MlaC/ttg2D family ABC transporter substrate-binding protein n=1 Tax=Candidatus Tisiphia endosymbiont of Ptychoptera albimana TaxID=3066260 RepID=UPI001D4BA6BB|nr:ABC transporter substrate-binding protein [Rickettsia endosymbiont of Sericostoma sp. HW-2014]
MKKFIVCLILNFLSLSAYSTANDNNAGVDSYVNQLIKNGLEVFNDQNLTQDGKIVKSKMLILANLDLDWMAKFTLGVYRRTLTPEQIKQFTEVYGNYVSTVYADLVKNYHGQQPKVEQVRILDKGEFMVEMLIGTAKVNYLVRQKDVSDNSSFKVSDVITEGVSMISSQQSEFMNILSNSGFDTLIDELVKKS